MATMGLIDPLLTRADPELASFLHSAHMPSFFTLSWLLTWFSHNISKLEDVCRVFDFLLSSHPLMSVYLAAATIVYFRGQVLTLPNEMPSVHAFFQNIGDDDDDDDDADDENNCSSEGDCDQDDCDNEQGADCDAHRRSARTPSTTKRHSQRAIDIDSVISITLALWEGAPPYLIASTAPTPLTTYTDYVGTPRTPHADSKTGGGAPSQPLSLSAPADAGSLVDSVATPLHKVSPPLLLTDPS